MLDLLTFVWTSIASPSGVCVSILFAVGIWLQVGVQQLRDRAAERAHLAELNGILADIPAPDRAQKRLIPSHRRTA